MPDYGVGSFVASPLRICTKMHQSSEKCTKILLVNDLSEAKRRWGKKSVFQGQISRLHAVVGVCIPKQKTPKSL